ncbi:MAG: PadR family transcriptional regulator [Clostridia bacterium]|nr:PadR family transcriptional regulator [Clostridia bacterium]
MLKRDLLQLCLLHLLTGGDCYGYQMISRLHDTFPDTAESAIYALLRDLARHGLAEVYQGQTSGGPARKYYRLTAAGEAMYQELLTQWRQIQGSMRALGLE